MTALGCRGGGHGRGVGALQRRVQREDHVVVARVLQVEVHGDGCYARLRLGASRGKRGRSPSARAMYSRTRARGM
jgi:hypothetical protein